MRVSRLQIENFRGIKEAKLHFSGHTLLIGGNNVGKSTICEALDLVLGPDRLNRTPPVEEFDFRNAGYLHEDGETPVPIRIEVVLIDLTDDIKKLCAADITDLAAIARLAEHLRGDLGHIDLLHVNAGIAELAPIVQVSEESYDRQFAVNTKGAFFTMQRLAPLIREGGAIVVTSSVADEGGEVGMSVYSATKAALVSFASAFAVELLPRNIRVNAVSPGFIDTPTAGVANMSAEERRAFFEIGNAVTPMRRHGTAEEVAKAVLFLGFEATFTTGTKLAVDGGLGQKISAPQ